MASSDKLLETRGSGSGPTLSSTPSLPPITLPTSTTHSKHNTKRIASFAGKSLLNASTGFKKKAIYGGVSLYEYRRSKRLHKNVTNIIETRGTDSLLNTAHFNRRHPATPQPPDLPDSMMSKERAIRINYDFLRKCVASAPVTGMAEETWQRILGRLAPPLLSSPLSSPLLPSLHEEVHASYEGTIRNTTIKMTLKKPSIEGLTEDPPLFSEELGMDYSTPWRARYEECVATLESSLHVTQPVMQAILQLWDKHRNKLLLDLSTVRSKGPVDIEHFRTLLVENACEHAEEKLRSSWYPHVIAMFNDPNNVGSASLTGLSRPARAHFYSCVYTLLGNQLRSMLSQTIQQYVELFREEDKTRLPQFKLHLCLEGQAMEFFPSIAELESAVVHLVETVAAAMSNLSTIEVWSCYHVYTRLCMMRCV
jgi:dynein heavy chain